MAKVAVVLAGCGVYDGAEINEAVLTLLSPTAYAQDVKTDHDPAYDFHFTKSAPSMFFGTPLITFLTKARVDTVIVTGVATSGCVRATIVDSFSHGYRTMVPEECCGDMEEGPHHDNLRDVGRRYADVLTLKDVLAYFAGRSDDPGSRL